ncbi:META domain-containing protein [Streptomyces rimosus]|uniref:META domain-containing protein n=1 Tax=Streptomyces rimosus TaxID=1927 RepID=UPI0004C61B7E|nr:META domain-containing protein [Streptomyces rimosus]
MTCRPREGKGARRAALASTALLAGLAALVGCGTDGTAQDRQGGGTGGTAAAQSGSDSGSDSDDDESPLPLAGPHWDIWEVSIGDSGLKRAPRGAAWVEFDGAGKASGNSGCHEFRAKADIEGDTVTVRDRENLPGAGDGESCDARHLDYEKDVRQILDGKLKITTNYAWVNLTDSHGSKLVLHRNQPFPLVGTEWDITKLSYMDEEWPIDEDAPGIGKVYVVLDADGTFRGNFGCNDYRGSADIGPKTIKFSQAEPTTDKQCSKAVMSREEEVRKRFDQSVGYQLGPDWLLATTHPYHNLATGFAAGAKGKR